jgi:hypothetical protein
MNNIKNIVLTKEYDFLPVNELEVNNGMIKNYNTEKYKDNRRGLLSFFSYNNLGKDIINRGMYAPIYVNRDNLILEGNHRVEGLKRIGANINLLCIYNPNNLYHLNKGILTYKLNKAKDDIESLLIGELGEIIKYTVDIDVYLLTELRLKMGNLPPASKFFTNKEIFKREMAEYERTKTSRN